jgi:hypothetical protein
MIMTPELEQAHKRASDYHFAQYKNRKLSTEVRNVHWYTHLAHNECWKFFAAWPTKVHPVTGTVLVNDVAEFSK